MSRTAVVLVVALAGIAPVTRAQGSAPESPAEPKPTVQEQVMLRGRNRALLHPSEPLKIGGREQDGNDMRSGTTALQRGKTATAGVDGDDTYERAIAMVENRAVFSTPPTRAAGETASAASAARKASSDRQRKAGAIDDSPRPSSNMPWAIGGLVAAALAVFGWLFVRNRG